MIVSYALACEEVIPQLFSIFFVEGIINNFSILMKGNSATQTKMTMLDSSREKERVPNNV